MCTHPNLNSDTYKNSNSKLHNESLNSQFFLNILMLLKVDSTSNTLARLCLPESTPRATRRCGVSDSKNP
jgi:hypothetical protein